MDFKEQLMERVSYVEEVIEKYIPQEKGFQKKVIEAMNYSILAGGKRLRPIFILETYRLFEGKDKEAVEPFLAAMEMIHTYSLVHDDLPAMDDDEYRRGRKTTHVVYGEAMGILAGDGLLNYAFETACQSFSSQTKLEQIAKAIQILAQKAGIYGMIGGQAVDVENCDRPLEQDRLNFIYQLKTGALIEASMTLGAVLAGAAEQEIIIMGKIASDIGLAFQIQDDILDITSTTEKLGKPINSDEKNHKTTYVTIKGIEASKKEVEMLSERAIRNLKSLKYENSFLEQLILSLIHREK